MTPCNEVSTLLPPLSRISLLFVYFRWDEIISPQRYFLQGHSDGKLWFTLVFLVQFLLWGERHERGGYILSYASCPRCVYFWPLGRNSDRCHSPPPRHCFQKHRRGERFSPCISVRLAILLVCHWIVCESEFLCFSSQ